MNILILDDHSLFSHGLGSILQDNLPNVNCLFFESIADLNVEKIDLNLLDLFISDIELPGEDIFHFLNKFKIEHPHIPILVVSMHNKLSVIRKCKEIEVQGYILKDDHEYIVTAVEKILAGEEYYSARVLDTLSILDEKENLLTPKEEEIIFLLVKGLDSQEIADKLFISNNTVKTHRKNIYKKLNVSKSSELIGYYNKNYI